MTAAAPLASADARASQPSVEKQAGNVSRIEWIALASVLVVAAAARFYRLDTSLWYDEIGTLLNFVRLPTRELIQSLKSNNHMFYSLQAQAAIALFSESAWSLRLPAVLFGLASLVAVWALARRAVGRAEALVVAFLLAISYDHVSFSQNARGCAGLLFWTTWATLLFARGLAGWAGERGRCTPSPWSPQTTPIFRRCSSSWATASSISRCSRSCACVPNMSSATLPWPARPGGNRSSDSAWPHPSPSLCTRRCCTRSQTLFIL